MDWTRSLQSSIDYIENHLTEDLDIEQIAKQAGFSSFYFQRIFNILCGFSIGEYIRSRRLTNAGNELNAANVKVIDIALKYGYESPEAFTRAFTKFHGISPSEARKSEAKLKLFSSLSVQLILKGGSIMDYRIVKKSSFKVLERVSRQNINDDENKNTIPDFWTASHRNGTVKKLLEITKDKSYIFGICYGNIPADCKSFDYSIAAVCDEYTEIPEGFRVNEIPARTWLVFDCVGAMPYAVQEMWHKICSEFFPTASFEPTYELDIEAYTAGDMTSSDYKSEIWVPVREK